MVEDLLTDVCAVRLSAKELTSLILDEERLRAERHDRKLWKQRVTGLEDYGAVSGGFAGGQEPGRRRKPQGYGGDEDDLEYKLAIEASKNQEEEDKRRRQSSRGEDTDNDLAKALKLSKEEEELRKKELEDGNANTLFDLNENNPQPQQQVQTTGWNQGYQQQGAVDWFGNPLDQQQQQLPQTTGFLSNAYAPTQATGMQQQQTGYPNGFGYNTNNPYQQQQTQPTGFDQQAQFQQPQQTFMQPQQTAFGMNNPYAQQSIQPQQEQPLQSGSNNPWGSNSNNLNDVKPQATGSNNPFASSFNRPQTASAQRAPTLSTLQEQKTSQFNSFTNTPSPFSAPPTHQPTNPFPSQPQPMQQPNQTGPPADPHRANLNQLLASGEGQDTFGNTGDLRIPAQHTAPGQFANSAGIGRTGMSVQQTGNNPFLHNQFTGAQHPGMQQPAQTGPAVGFGGSNPFGQNRQQGPGGNLIDL